MENNIDKLAELGLHSFIASSTFWKKCYEDASDTMKQYYKYLWGANHRRHTVLIEQDDDDLVDALFKKAGEAMSKFSLDDWNYLIDRTNYPMKKVGLIKMRDERFPPK